MYIKKYGPKTKEITSFVSVFLTWCLEKIPYSLLLRSIHPPHPPPPPPHFLSLPSWWDFSHSRYNQWKSKTKLKWERDLERNKNP